jgi:hypothetical protein
MRFQFNFQDGDAGVLRCPPELMVWLNRQFVKLKGALPGPFAIARGTVTTDIEVKLGDVSLLQLTLGDDIEITLVTAQDVRAGAEAKLELTQDATGSRAVTWVNATGTGGSVPAPTATANKKTLYLATYNGTTWLLSVLSSNY